MKIAFPFVDLFSERITVETEISGHFQLTFVASGAGTYQWDFVEIEHLSIDVLSLFQMLLKKTLVDVENLLVTDVQSEILQQYRLSQRVGVSGKIESVHVDIEIVLFLFTEKGKNLPFELFDEGWDVVRALVERWQDDAHTEKDSLSLFESRVGHRDDLCTVFLNQLEKFRKIFDRFETVNDQFVVLFYRLMEFGAVGVDDWRAGQNEFRKRVSPRSGLSADKCIEFECFEEVGRFQSLLERLRNGYEISGSHPYRNRSSRGPAARPGR